MERAQISTLLQERPRVLSLGETMAMVTPSKPTPLVESDTFTITPGGAESNVASHLAGAGIETFWASRLGDDALGDRIEGVLSGRGIDLSCVTRDRVAPTGVYFKDPEPGARKPVAYYRAGSAASRMSVEDAASWPLDRIGWLHTSGITAALSQSCYQLVEHVLSNAGHHGYGTSFDVNYRPALLSRDEAAERSLRLGRMSTVVLVGLDEAQELWNVETAEDVASLFPRVPYVVVKDGALDACEFDTTAGTTRALSVAARKVEVLEAVGAGDAFAAGYLLSLFNGKATPECLDAGHELAAWTLGSLDDFRAHPTYHAIDGSTSS